MPTAAASDVVVPSVSAGPFLGLGWYQSKEKPSDLEGFHDRPLKGLEPSTDRQCYRRLGRAWVQSAAAGSWRKRRGRAPEGYLDRHGAEWMMDELIDRVERGLVEVQPDREATFTDAVREWRSWAEHTKRHKPATLRNYDALPSPPGRATAPRRTAAGADHAPSATAASPEVTSVEVERFPRGPDREGLPGRSVNSRRQALTNVFECATCPDGFALPSNPVRRTDKRREDYSKPPETFNPEQVMALARVAREGRHVDGGRRWASREENLEQQRSNEQDGAMYIVAGFTGPAPGGAAGRCAGATSASRTARSSWSQRCRPGWGDDQVGQVARDAAHP